MTAFDTCRMVLFRSVCYDCCKGEQLAHGLCLLGGLFLFEGLPSQVSLYVIQISLMLNFLYHFFACFVLLL